MTCVLNFYGDRLENIDIVGKPEEKVLIIRRGKSTDSRVINDEKKILAFSDSNLNCGDLITRKTSKDNNSYFIVAKQATKECVECQGIRINAKATICKLDKLYDDVEYVGNIEEIVLEDVPIYFKDVSANMKFYDAGLLKDTTKIIMLQNSVDIEELYRIKFNGVNYQVDNIDIGRYENMLYIQLSEDTRSTNE
ncbi:hypothetical protein [Megamonas funiformis]|jgi:hypothetical protein|uniref:hypothetical protein n=1 Tax=Megamonas funiformis TaxID=437897 RepID=UPI0022E2FC88|nr:hypothetical protein [Megamonas funiformis]